MDVEGFPPTIDTSPPFPRIMRATPGIVVLASAALCQVSGLPLRIIMSLTVGPDFSLVVRPEIRRMERDPEGKTLATSGVGEFTDVGARLVLKRYGLAPEVDVKLRALFGNNYPLRPSALQAGQIDGTVMSMPSTRWRSRWVSGNSFTCEKLSKRLRAGSLPRCKKSAAIRT